MLWHALTHTTFVVYRVSCDKKACVMYEWVFNPAISSWTVRCRFVENIHLSFGTAQWLVQTTFFSHCLRELDGCEIVFSVVQCYELRCAERLVAVSGINHGFILSVAGGKGCLGVQMLRMAAFSCPVLIGVPRMAAMLNMTTHVCSPKANLQS